MNCLEVKELLSAYYDEELNGDIRTQVAAHVATCEDCTRRLAEFKSYGDAFAMLPQPKVPEGGWDEIAGLVDGVDGVRLADRQRPFWRSPAVLSLAASVLLLLGIGMWMRGHSDHADSHHAEFVATMDRYLTTLATDPAQAEAFLLSQYDGQTVQPEDAIKLVGYRPAVASGLPDNYTLTLTSVMKMPCCTCVKAVCKRQDGSTLVLFEHDDEETEWFGHRESNLAMCGDKECCLVDLDSSIAATWRQGSRWVTAVRARDEDEVSELVTWLESKVSSNGKTL